jgi:FkbM family methyltransferase
MSFEPYIARDRCFNDFKFDFHIVNETAKSWYDGSANQWMPEREWCVSRLSEGMTVVDCGAHHGMLSIIFANAVGRSGRVFAYEPLPSNAIVIQQNAVLNHQDNVVVRAVGVGDMNATTTVNLNASNTVIVDDSGEPASNTGEPITVVRLDDDLDPATKIDFIKIDVEGHDLQALRGMSRILGQCPAIDLELHNFIFQDKASTLRQIIAILEPLGYDWELLGEIVGRSVSLGNRLPIEQIIAFDNPHLFGLPRHPA